MQKKERETFGGSKKYGKEKPLAWRQALVPESLEESMDFERGEDPKKSMNVGKERIKVYKCGVCGAPTDKDGFPYFPGNPEFEKTIDLDTKMQGAFTEKTHCDQCINDNISRMETEQEKWEQEEEDRRWREENGPFGHG